MPGISRLINRSKPIILKIIPFYDNEKQLIAKAIRGNHDAQKKLYTKLSPKMMSVCRQYIADIHHCEDVLVSSFVKVFEQLEHFRFEGSFEGWVRRIVVRDCISFLRKKQFLVYDDSQLTSVASDMVQTDLDVAHLQQLIDALPEGYRMVFMLFAVEGYSHKEIASTLHISESTSKSQLHKARKRLQEQVVLVYKEQGYGQK